MRPLRAISLVLATILALSVSLTDGQFARAQSVDDAQEQAEAAERQAAVAAGLVDEAVANRAQLELDLLNTITRINQLSDELSRLSVGLDRISEQLGYADVELAGIDQDIALRAVDAYMNALSSAPVIVVNSSNVEEAMVTGVVAGEVISSDQSAFDALIVKKRDLESLREQFLAQQEAVAAKQEEFDREVELLAELYETANSTVADAIRAANAADAAHRAALEGVEAAAAKAAEEDRQDTTTTTATTTPGSATATTSPSAATTTTSSYPWTPPPEVEQWRSLVAQFFPANRVDEALHIMWCESRGDPNAYNPYSGASGLFQFIPSTWATTAGLAGFPGASPFDPVANTGSAAWLANRYEELGQYYWTAWNCNWVLD
ncbi:MAG: transglycosylase SLT domain-containing protein [Acidimicrobiia bacterium]|nr:transglycosylase SLT domain-containing protein [Acidimicrobiia bacterium]MDH3464061.1 transglycosylase SLT domain-containing protein [Acidimicrobiia bacterium]